MRCVEDRASEMVDADLYDGVAYLGPMPSDEVDVPYFGDEEPHAFLVEIGANRDPIKTHYHRVDQFQYVRSGSGKIVPHPVVEGTVHYTDAYTPYGPVAPGAEGLSYVTLRGIVDNGAFYMPQSRADLKSNLAKSARAPRSRRNLTVELLDPSPAREGRADDGWDDVVSDVDGLRIAVQDVPPGGTIVTPVVGGGGAYFVVASGVVRHDAEEHGTGSLVWLDPGEATGFQSERGARLGMLQFPVPGPRAQGNDA